LPGYEATFARRNDVESMHCHVNDVMFNDCVSTTTTTETARSLTSII
jgi:hypothetical protein